MIAPDVEVEVRQEPGNTSAVVFSVAHEAFAKYTGATIDWYDLGLLASLQQWDSALARLLTAIQNELAARRFACDVAIEGLQIQLLCELNRLIHGKPDRANALGFSAGELRRVTDIIEDELPRGVSVADLARRMGISYRHFSRLFKNAKGISIRDHVANVRLRRVEDLLENTNLPMKTIASRVGLASGNHLASAFQRNRGIQPSAFRRLMRSASKPN